MLFFFNNIIIILRENIYIYNLQSLGKSFFFGHQSVMKKNKKKAQNDKKSDFAEYKVGEGGKVEKNEK